MALTPASRSRISSLKPREADLAKAFHAADKDGNGRLNLKEYVQLFHAQGVNMSEEDAKEYFSEKDKDLDGEITFEEFIGKESNSEKVWHAMNKNKDDVVSPDEIKQALKKYKRSLGDVAPSLEQKLNRNWEKGITYAQFCALMNRSASVGSAGPVKASEHRPHHRSPSQSRSHHNDRTHRHARLERKSSESTMHFSRHLN